jgi:hypothetical protein
LTCDFRAYPNVVQTVSFVVKMSDEEEDEELHYALDRNGNYASINVDQALGPFSCQECGKELILKHYRQDEHKSGLPWYFAHKANAGGCSRGKKPPPSFPGKPRWKKEFKPMGDVIKLCGECHERVDDHMRVINKKWGYYHPGECWESFLEREQQKPEGERRMKMCFQCKKLIDGKDWCKDELPSGKWAFFHETNCWDMWKSASVESDDSEEDDIPIIKEKPHVKQAERKGKMCISCHKVIDTGWKQDRIGHTKKWGYYHDGKCWKDHILAQIEGREELTMAEHNKRVLASHMQWQAEQARAKEKAKEDEEADVACLILIDIGL